MIPTFKRVQGAVCGPKTAYGTAAVTGYAVMDYKPLMTAIPYSHWGVHIGVVGAATVFMCRGFGGVEPYEMGVGAVAALVGSRLIPMVRKGAGY